jgi:hypothetical protein
MGFIGILSLVTILLIDEIPPALNELWSPGFSAFGGAILANIAYTGGWVCELLVCLFWPQKSKNFGPSAFKKGLVFSIGLCLLLILVDLFEYFYRLLHS